MRTLGKLDAASLTQHAAAVVGRLEDSDANVRGAAVETLGKLDVASLAPCMQAIVKAAEADTDSNVRAAASKVFDAYHQQ